MRHIQESIRDRKSTFEEPKTGSFRLEDLDIVKIAEGTYFMVLLDKKYLNMIDYRLPKDGALYFVTPGGVPDKHNFLDIKDFNEKLEFERHNHVDKDMCIAEVWRSTRPRIPDPDILDTMLDTQYLKTLTTLSDYKLIWRRK